MAETVERIEPTEFQQRVLAIPEDYDVFLGGGRGGGKTFSLLLLILRHVEVHGVNARVLVVRKDFPSLRDFEGEARYLFGKAYGKALKFNAQEHIFRFPSGATVQLDQIETHQDFTKYQGKSFSLIATDEAGQYASPEVLDLLRSSLRSKAGIPCRFILAANPGGPGHVWLQQRHVAGVTPWKPYTEPRTEETFVTAPSVLEDNPHMGADYAKRIRASTATDPELQKAWLRGDWNIARGGYFAGVFDEKRCVIEPWTSLPNTSYEPGLTRMQERWRAQNAQDLGRRTWMHWETFIAGDHGVGAPAVFYLVARSPGSVGPDGCYYPRGSLILFDEVAFAERDDVTQGLGLTVPRMAKDVVERCQSWGMSPQGCLDDACFAKHGSEQGTLADEYRKAGFVAHPVRKGDRISGWETMRRMLMAAGSPDQAGLYISQRCTYWLQTVPLLPRDPRRPEDVDTKAADHAADATRYAVLFERPHINIKKLGGF